MLFVMDFVKVFAVGIYLTLPLLIPILLFIVTMGLLIGRREGWSVSDSVCFSVITATTVGYGDMHPKTGPSKYLAVMIAFSGLLRTGVNVATGLYALHIAHGTKLTFEQIGQQFEQVR